MNRRDFFKLGLSTLAAALFPTKGYSMPTQNYSGDTLTEILKDLYGKTGQTPPAMLMDTLARQVDEERKRDEILKSWVALDGKIKSNVIDLPFVPISSTVLEEDKNEIVIQIPGQYKHLFMLGQGRINGSGGQPAVMALVQFNEDTAANYVWGHVIHVGTTVSAGQDLAATSVPFMYMVADGWAAGPAGCDFMYVPHYNSGYYKNIFIIGSIYGTNTNTALRQGNWKNTTPIRTLRIFPDPAYAGAKLEAGSLISVYGIN